MIIAIASALSRAILICILIYMITRLHDILNLRERMGAGIMGGSGFMTIAVILDVSKEGTPYDVWAGMLFSIGAAVFFWGFIDRKLGHERRNKRATHEADAYLRVRGKL